MGGRGRVVLVAALLLPMLAPGAIAGHCASDLYIYGRGSATPGVVAPTAPLAAECVLFPGGIVHQLVHTLAPGTDQVLVRFFVDVGPSYPVLPVRLEGFGWTGQAFVLERTTGAAGTFYTLRDWVYAPDPYESTTLRASVRLPGGNEVTTEYERFPVTVMTNLGQ